MSVNDLWLLFLRMPSTKAHSNIQCTPPPPIRPVEEKIIYYSIIILYTVYVFSQFWFVCLLIYQFFFNYISSVVMLVACIFFCNKVCLSKKKSSSSRWHAKANNFQCSRLGGINLNSNAYSVGSSIFKNSLSQVLFFPKHNKGIELVT